MLDYRTVWISDIHLGTRGCQAEYLRDFLNNVECDTLYLVGDIIDYWKLKSGIYWPYMHNEVVRTILDKAKKGTRVVYIPGNHDEIFRQYAGSEFLGVEIRRNAVHESADGKKYLVLHGDEFDGIVCHSKWLAHLGSGAYDLLFAINTIYNALRRICGYRYWSLSAYIKHKVKNAVSFISNFEQVLGHEAVSKGMDGVICGHIHHAAVSMMTENLIYANCGDWVEICTALVEDAQGEISIIRWIDDSVHLLNGNDNIETSTDKRRLASAN